MLVQFLIIATLSSVSLSVLATNNVVEVLFVVEPHVIRNYIEFGYDKETAEKTLRGDIDFILYEVNQVFTSMQKYQLNIEVRAKKLVISNDELFDCKLSNGLQVRSGMDAFQKWLSVNEPIEDNGNYDLAILWTGCDMHRVNNRRLGYAYRASVCTQNAVALVEFDGTIGSAYVTAFEIGHSLGHWLDGQNNLCRSGVEELGSFVSPFYNVDDHRWQFSQCATEAIKQHLDILHNRDRNCLETTTTPTINFNIASQANRDIVDIQKICQRTMRTTKGYLRISQYSGGPAKGDAICEVIFCAVQGEQRFHSTKSTENVICDIGKRCSKGKCVSAPPTLPVPSNVRSDCVYGDEKTDNVQRSNKTCEEYLKGKDHYCYNSRVRSMCCQSCYTRNTQVKDCEYGDRDPVYCKNMRYSSLFQKVGNFCCYTRNHRRKRSLIHDLSPSS